MNYFQLKMSLHCMLCKLYFLTEDALVLHYDSDLHGENRIKREEGNKIPPPVKIEDTPQPTTQKGKRGKPSKEWYQQYEKYLGRSFNKLFIVNGKEKYFKGIVTNITKHKGEPLFRITYDDGDEEDLNLEELEEYLN